MIHALRTHAKRTLAAAFAAAFALGSALFNAGGYVFKGLIGQPLSLFH